MIPKVVLLGRPNVGKSTLFNRLIRSNRAITHDRPGVTRDRMEGVVRSRSRALFSLIDTGGINLDAHEAVTEGPRGIRGFEEDILQQAQAAMGEADVLCLVVDGREGLTPFDEHLAAHLRRSGKAVLVAVNKVDGLEKEDEMLAEFHALGFPLLAVSAEHGHNIRALEEELLERLPERDDEDAEEDPLGGDLAEYQMLFPSRRENPKAPLKLCLLGRPNAGKSSLVNAFLQSERMIVSNVAGTTRDSVDIPFRKGGKSYILVDTAGVRRRAKISDQVERFSVNSSLKSTTKAHVTMLVIDVTEGLTGQDKRLVELLDERKTPFMILLNKMDLVPKKERNAVLHEFTETLRFCAHVPLMAVSAHTRDGIAKILPVAERIYDECGLRVPTGQLNRAMEECLTKHQAPVVKRVRPKFFYLTQAESQPPTFVFFVNDAERVAEAYVRYLEKNLRRIFGIKHAPMRLHLRSSHGKKKDD